jgi:hypothetical protein
MCLAGIGEAHLHVGHPEMAIAALEEALAHPLKNQDPNLVPFLVRARFALARALWETGGDRRRAQRLASEALEPTLSDPESVKLREEIQAWQSKHP